MVDSGLVIVAAVSVILTTTLRIFKEYMDDRYVNREKKEIDSGVNNTFENLNKAKQFSKDDDVLALMLKNVAELKEYYIMNKQQARNAFSTALLVSIFGFSLFAAGLILTFFGMGNVDSLIYSGISGAIVEIIAGLFFWLYRQSLNQLNLFHESLRNTERFLTAIKLVENVSDANKDQMYGYIVQSIFANQKEILLAKKEDNNTGKTKDGIGANCERDGNNV